jgi:hypothetical protein
LVDRGDIDRHTLIHIPLTQHYHTISSHLPVEPTMLRSNVGGKLDAYEKRRRAWLGFVLIATVTCLVLVYRYAVCECVCVCVHHAYFVMSCNNIYSLHLGSGNLIALMRGVPLEGSHTRQNIQYLPAELLMTGEGKCSV